MNDLTSLRTQADSGDPDAQVRLARASLLGRGMPFAPEDALRLFDAACEKDWPEALLQRAALSIIGLATPRNYETAFQFLKRAADKGDPRALGQMAVLADANGRFDLDVWRAPPDLTVQFETPRLFTLKQFLPRPVCEWLIARSRDEMRPAARWDAGNGGHVVDSYRTNSDAGLPMLTPDLVVLMVNLRIAAATAAPLLHQEPTVILHYEVGQEYKPHFDFIGAAKVEPLVSDLKRMGQRVATCLVYLNDGYEGGETDFPQLNWRFKGEPGDALFFRNLSVAGAPEMLSLHAGLPVKCGEKWLLSKWIRQKQVPLWWPG